MGEHPRVRHAQSCRVGPLERSFDPAVEDRLVPRGQLLGCDVLQPGAGGVALDTDRDRGRVVVSVPLDDRRVVAEHVDGGTCLFDRLGPYRPCVAPAAAGSPAAAGCRARRRHRRSLRGAMWPCTREHVEPGFDGELDVASHVGRRCVSQPGPRREQVGALEEQPLAVDRARPVVPGDHPQTGAA